MLFSATQTKNVEDLARISLRKAPLYVGVDDDKETSTVDGLEQVSFLTYFYPNSEIIDQVYSILVSYTCSHLQQWNPSDLDTMGQKKVSVFERCAYFRG